MRDDMDLPLEGADYFIYLMELPPKVYAFIHPNEDGTYSVYLDPRRDFWHWVDDIEHEWWHMIREDFWNGKPIWVVEAA